MWCILNFIKKWWRNQGLNLEENIIGRRIEQTKTKK